MTIYSKKRQASVGAERSELLNTFAGVLENLSLPFNPSVAVTLDLLPDDRNCDIPIRLTLALGECNLHLRQMEFLLGPGSIGIGERLSLRSEACTLAMSEEPHRSDLIMLESRF